MMRFSDHRVRIPLRPSESFVTLHSERTKVKRVSRKQGLYLVRIWERVRFRDFGSSDFCACGISMSFSFSPSIVRAFFPCRLKIAQKQKRKAGSRLNLKRYPKSFCYFAKTKDLRPQLRSQKLHRQRFFFIRPDFVTPAQKRQRSQLWFLGSLHAQLVNSRTLLLFTHPDFFQRAKACRSYL